MSEKQTRCPTCSTVYKVSVTQLTVAQGMVCCPKCSSDFNALRSLVDSTQLVFEADSKNQSQISQNHSENQLATAQELHVLDIFERKIESSNINLRTYLNNLNYFDSDPISQFPTLNLSSGMNKENRNHKNLVYYGTWSIINLMLVFILIFQILWFNPSFLDKSALLNSFFIHACNLVTCETLDQRYRQVEIKELEVRATKANNTEFSGVLINNYKKGLALPLIKVSLLDKGKAKTSYIEAPSDYLIDSLVGITRIPTNQPYHFKFEIKQSRKSFESYKLELIRP